jgi:hypothetical protein
METVLTKQDLGGMTMKSWKLQEAKEHFAEVVQFCTEEPQLLCEQDVPLAVVIDVGLFKTLAAAQQRQRRPTIAHLLDELQAIKTLEPVDLDIPDRQDRTALMEEVLHGISV